MFFTACFIAAMNIPVRRLYSDLDGNYCSIFWTFSDIDLFTFSRLRYVNKIREQYLWKEQNAIDICTQYGNCIQQGLLYSFCLTHNTKTTASRNNLDSIMTFTRWGKTWRYNKTSSTVGICSNYHTNYNIYRCYIIQKLWKWRKEFKNMNYES